MIAFLAKVAMCCFVAYVITGLGHLVMNGHRQSRAERKAMSFYILSWGYCECAVSPPDMVGFEPEQEYRFERVLDNDFDLRYTRVYMHGYCFTYSSDVFNSHFFVTSEIVS